MPRSLRVAALAASLLALTAPAAAAHSGNPNYLSQLRSLEPATPAVRVRVINRDDRFELTAQGGHTVVVEGYSGEPYARVLADGTVQVNRRSPATYLNEDRFANVAIPMEADEDAAAEWRTLDRTGRFDWHDHRMHWMGQGTPPQITDEGRRTKVFDYEVPLRVDGRDGRLAGTLFWEPTPSGYPLAPFVGLGVLAVAAPLLVVLVRRRRRVGLGGGVSEHPAAEAW